MKTAGIVIAPAGFHHAFRVDGLQLEELLAITTVNGNAASHRYVAHDAIARNRLAAACNVVHKVAYAFYDNAVFAFGFLLGVSSTFGADVA